MGEVPRYSPSYGTDLVHVAWIADRACPGSRSGVRNDKTKIKKRGAEAPFVFEQFVQSVRRKAVEAARSACAHQRFLAAAGGLVGEVP